MRRRNVTREQVGEVQVVVRRASCGEFIVDIYLEPDGRPDEAQQIHLYGWQFVSLAECVWRVTKSLMFLGTIKKAS